MVQQFHIVKEMVRKLKNVRKCPFFGFDLWYYLGIKGCYLLKNLQGEKNGKG
jgi:hypothetical protein